MNSRSQNEDEFIINVKADVFICNIFYKTYNKLWTIEENGRKYIFVLLVYMFSQCPHHPHILQYTHFEVVEIHPPSSLHVPYVFFITMHAMFILGYNQQS